ncbi:MAG: TetR/AcrR family transcriptional regulator, partial [Eubacteriales bacterium]
MNKKAGEILNKTITLLVKTGGLGVSMDEVAAFAGVSKMTIYKYFSDKTTLFDKAGKAVMARSMAELSDTVHNDKSLV